MAFSRRPVRTLGVLGVAALCAGLVFAESAEEPFNCGWRFFREGCAEESVVLPHDAAIAGPFDDSLENCTGLLPYFGKATYVKRFEARPDAAVSRYLEFGGVMSCSKVFVNGRFAAERPYGYSSFRVPLDEFLLDGTNEVRVELAPPKTSARWYSGFGIYRDVRLRTVDRRAHVGWNGLSVRTDGNRAVVDVEIEGGESSRATWRAHVVGGKGLAVENPKLWSPETPNLYELEAEVLLDGKVTDRRRVKFGFRSLRFDRREGFFLNGVRRQMKGVCLHHDLGSLGAAFDAGAARRQIAILKEMGCDAIRTSHNPPAAEFLDLCDEMGMMVMVESFDVWEAYKSRMDYARFFREWHERDLVDLVKRDRNHPCVVMWSVGNEILEHREGGPEGRHHVADGLRIGRRLTDIVHRLDDRPVTCGYWDRQALTNGMADVVDVFGANYLPEHYAGFRGRQGVIGTETCSMISSRGEYFFPLGTTYPERGSLACCSDGFRNNQVSSYDLYPQRMNNYPPDREFESQERNPHVYGEFVWTGFDYLGGTDPFKGPVRSSYYGILDLCGFPKDRYYCYQAQWRPELPMAHLLPHWTWPGREGQVTPVHVYTSGDEAELFVNGVSQGRRRKSSYQYRLVWDKVLYEPGELKVVVWKDGRPWATDAARTAGAPVAVRASCTTWGDLDYWQFTAVDAGGNVAPTGSLRLTFAVTDGDLVGVGNGDPTDHDSLKGDTIRTFHALAQAIVRRHPGKDPKLTWTVTAREAVSSWPGFSRGMGIGGWLTNYKRFNVLPEDRRLAITEGDLEHFDGYITEADVKNIKSMGFDHVRLGFDQIVVEERPGVWRERTFRKIDDFVGWCDRHGLNVVLNLHKAVGNYCDVPEKVQLLDDPVLQSRVVALWLEIERRYHDRPGVAFELLNEVRDVEPEKWNAFADRLVREIRSKNPVRPIVVGSRCWNTPGALAQLKVWDDPNVIYTFHNYEPFEFTHQRGVLMSGPLAYNRELTYPCDDVGRYRGYHELWGNTNSYPNVTRIDRRILEERLRPAFDWAKAHPDKILWLGEFGTIRHAPKASRVAYMRDTVELCKEHGIPWCVWNYLSTPNDGNRFSLVDDDTREFLSPELLNACLGE